MTFGDFKKHFETFSKIDTAEKLAICEKQYQQHLLDLEDQDYFEPTDNKSGHDLTSEYERNLHQILSPPAHQDNSFSFLVIPSFEPEHLLTIKKEKDLYFVTLTVLAKSYWTIFYADNKVMDAKKQIIVSGLKKEIGDILFELLNKTVVSARKPNAKRIVLDGVIYNLSKNSSNKPITVTKHSPDPASKSGKVIAVMERLIKTIEDPNNTELAQLTTEINNLLT